MQACHSLFIQSQKPESDLGVVTSTNDSNALPDIPGGRLAYPTLQGSTAEAAFMTGMERNSDVVFASACLS